MLIDGLTVCVDYSDLLALSLPRWLDALDSLVVVTTPEDKATQELTKAAWYFPELADHRCKIRCHLTRVFYADGASFNKAAAMQEAIAGPMLWRHWIVLFDADIVPPADLRQRLEAADLRPGNLYGGHRHLGQPEDGDRPAEDLPELTGRGQKVPGCFQLFNICDALAREGLLDTSWSHAGNYDSLFQARWPSDRQIVLDIHYIHLGEPGLNWWGRTDPETGRARRQAMLEERRRRGGTDHERIR